MSRHPSVLFVNQHYWPDVASTGQHLTDLAEHLAAAGWRVRVLTSRVRYEGGRLAAPRREVHRGVEIVRLGGFGFGRARHLGRALDYAAFLAGAGLRGVLGRGHDIVVFLTTPSLIGVLGPVWRLLRRRRYAIWSMDVHPDIERALGILPSGAPARILQALGDASYRRAELVVALGSRMRERLLARGVAPERATVIPVWSRADEIEPVPRGANPLAAELGLGDRFVVMYSGNAGLAHRFDEVLAAIERLSDDERILFLFAGGGPRKPEILARVGDRPNVRYLGYQPRESLARSLSLGDLHLLTLRTDMAGLAVPGKLYGIMAAGRPVLMVGPRDSDSARTIEEEGAGIVVDPREAGAVERVVAAIERLRDDRDEARAMGARGREAFLGRYERVVACQAWEERLGETLGESR